MGSLGRLSLVFWTVFKRVAHVNPLDDEDLVLDEDLTFGL